MRIFMIAAAASLLMTGAVMAQSGGEARPSAGGATRLSPVTGGGQSTDQAKRDNLPNHTRESPYAHPGANPNVPGDAASDGSDGTSSPRSPEPKPN